MDSIALALVLVFLSTFGFAGAAILQHSAIGVARASGEKRAMSVRQLLALLQTPRWLLGSLLVIVAATLHMAALYLAPVSVVQPVGILAVPWTVLLASRLYGYRPTASVWMAVAATIAGVFSFTTVAARVTGTGPAVVNHVLIVLAVLTCFAIGGVVLAVSRRLPHAFRSLMLAAGGALLFGLTSALIKTVFVLWGLGESMTSPSVVLSALVAAVACLAGGWMVQQAFAVGHPEIVVASLTTIDPVVAVIYGLVVLDEGLGLSAPALAAMVACGVVAACGVVGLARFHPDTRRNADAEAGAAPLQRPDPSVHTPEVIDLCRASS